MRTTTLTITIEARADSSESEIKAAVLDRARDAFDTPLKTKKDRKPIRVRLQLDNADHHEPELVRQFLVRDEDRCLQQQGSARCMLVRGHAADHSYGNY